ncbi:MAG TPA: hypothetical protein VLL76_06385 [Candidatus Omnitrophota bacterium]|nr:hypothetical protein [Candidatus Omnitrophota bacterium]
MTCKICGAETADGTDHCGEPCRLKLECLRIAWDREARKVGVNGYYDRRYQEHVRTNNTRGAKVIRNEWLDAKARLGERP